MTAPPELDSVMAFLGPALGRVDAIPGDATLERACATHVTGNAKLTPAEQVDIYRRQFWLRHVDSLEEDYPTLAQLLGEDAFDTFCRAYLVAHPPRAPSLRDLGADIVGFAERYEAFDAAIRGAALDTIRYEHAFVDLFDGADSPPLDQAKLAAVPEDAWDRACVVLHPLLARFRLDYAVHRMRLAVRSGEPLVILPPSRATWLVLYRRDTVIHFEELDPAAYALLEALADGEPLAPACERVASALPPEEAEAFGAHVGPWFQQWTSLGWIVDVVVRP